MLRSTLIICLLLVLQIGAAGQDSIQIDSIAYALDLDEFVVTGLYEPTHYKKALHRVSIIKEEQIQERAATSIDEVLQLNPSIRVVNDPILGKQIRMRGIDAANVAILIDGVPIIGRLDGAIDLSQIPTQNIKRIEIIEGPQSNIYGNNAGGGVINIITHASNQPQTSFSIHHQRESIGITNTEANAAFSWGQISGGIYGRHFTYEQFPEDSLRVLEKVVRSDSSSFFRKKYPWNPKTQYAYGGHLKYKFNEHHSLRFNLSINDEVVDNLGQKRRLQFRPYSNDEQYKTKRSDYSLFYRGSIKKTGIESTFAYNHYRRNRIQQRYLFESNQYDSIHQSIETNIFENYFARLHLAHPLNDRWEYLAGGTFNLEQGQGPNLMDSSKIMPNITSYLESAFYQQLYYKPNKRLTLSPSIRWTWHSAYQHQFTPAVHAKYAFKNWTLRASLAQGYRNPSLKELYLRFIDVNHFIIGNPNLKAEKTTDYQASVQYQKQKLGASVNVFYTHIDERIQLIQFEDLKFEYQNLSYFRSKGIQASLQWEYEGLEIQTQLNFSSIKSNQAVSWANFWDFNQQLRYRIPKVDIQCSMNYRLQGKSPIFISNNDDEVTTVFRPSIHFLDLSCSRDFWKERILLNVGVKNLFNVQSVNISASSGAHSAGERSLIDQGTSFFLRMQLKLKT